MADFRLGQKITRGFTQQSVARIPAGFIGCSQVLHLQAATFFHGGNLDLRSERSLSLRGIASSCESVVKMELL